MTVLNVFFLNNSNNESTLVKAEFYKDKSDFEDSLVLKVSF